MLHIHNRNVFNHYYHNLQVQAMASHLQTCSLVCLSLLVLLLPYASAADYHFNPSFASSCITLNANCSLLNPTFYDTNTTIATSPDDTITILITNTTEQPTLILPRSTLLSIASLTISGPVTLYIDTASQLEVCTLLYPNSIFTQELC